MTQTILSVDMQNAFCSPGGALYQPRACVPFVTDVLVPFAHTHGMTVAEIISDYRAPAGGSAPSMCVPGQWDYESCIPAVVKQPNVWIKAEPSPAWTRAGAGRVEHPAGVPYPDPAGFSAWLQATVGPPTHHHEIILVGLMLEVCVISTLQELYYRGYRVKVLFEGVDTYSGSLAHKRALFDILFPFWGQPVFWSEITATRT